MGHEARCIRSWVMAIVAATLLVGGGCQRLTDQKAAIQEAIEEHLSGRSDLAMDQMVMEMGEVKVEGDSATAEVVFRATTEPTMRMAYHYELRREGRRWQVATGRPSAAEATHPTLGETGGESESSAERESAAPGLPEGHPPIPEGSSPLPEGNPPIPEGAPRIQEPPPQP